MSYWAVVQCEAQREHAARVLIMKLGLETYAPRIKVRNRKAFLFPTYIFTRIERRWYPVRWTPHVVRILMAGEEPARLDERIIEAIRKREVNGMVRLPKAESKFRQGQPVRIIRGSFEGQLAICEGMSGHERIKVLLDLLGRKVPVEIPAADLQVAR